MQFLINTLDHIKQEPFSNFSGYNLMVLQVNEEEEGPIFNFGNTFNNSQQNNNNNYNND